MKQPIEIKRSSKPSKAIENLFKQPPLQFAQLNSQEMVIIIQGKLPSTYLNRHYQRIIFWQAGNQNYITSTHAVSELLDDIHPEAGALTCKIIKHSKFPENSWRAIQADLSLISKNHKLTVITLDSFEIDAANNIKRYEPPTTKSAKQNPEYESTINRIMSSIKVF